MLHFNIIQVAKIPNYNAIIDTINITAHSGRIYGIQVLQDDYLATASSDTTVKIWNPKQKSLEKTLIGHKKQVTALVVLLNGELASGSNDTTIKIWNTTGLC